MVIGVCLDNCVLRQPSEPHSYPKVKKGGQAFETRRVLQQSVKEGDNKSYYHTHTETLIHCCSWWAPLGTNKVHTTLSQRRHRIT
jgi:hypothetical protein